MTLIGDPDKLIAALRLIGAADRTLIDATSESDPNEGWALLMEVVSLLEDATLAVDEYRKSRP